MRPAQSFASGGAHAASRTPAKPLRPWRPTARGSSCRVVALLQQQQQQRSVTSFTSSAVGDGESSPSSNAQPSNQSRNNAVPFPRPAIGEARRTPLDQEQRQPSTRREGAEPSGPAALRRSAAENAAFFFAYASCLHRDTLFSRDVTGVLSRDPATLSDPSVRLAFRGVGGCATLISAPNSDTLSPPRRQPRPPGDGVVHGVLYRMEQAELLKLKKSRAGYQLTEMEVKTYNGREVRAWVFVASPMDTLPAEVAPPEAYMRQVREGAADQHLHHDYQAWLSSIETVPSAGLPGEYFDTPKNKVQHTLQYLLATVAIGALALAAAMKGLVAPPM